MFKPGLNRPKIAQESSICSCNGLELFVNLIHKLLPRFFLLSCLWALDLIVVRGFSQAVSKLRIC